MKLLLDLSPIAVSSSAAAANRCQNVLYRVSFE